MTICCPECGNYQWKDVLLRAGRCMICEEWPENSDDSEEQAVIYCKNHRSLPWRMSHKIAEIFGIEFEWDWKTPLEDSIWNLRERIRFKYESSKKDADFWSREWKVLEKQLDLVKEKLRQWTAKISQRKK